MEKSLAFVPVLCYIEFVKKLCDLVWAGLAGAAVWAFAYWRGLTAGAKNEKGAQAGQTLNAAAKAKAVARRVDADGHFARRVREKYTRR